NEKINSKNNEELMNLKLWLGYCHFHAANYRNAKNIYEQMLGDKHCPNEVYLYLGCSFFFLGLYENAKKVAEKASKCPLQTRLLFHVSHKINDKKSLVSHHGQLKDTTEDQLCLASVHYLRSHYQQAIDIYKKVLAKNKTYLAINVYMALCYYKLDYYDISMEMLQIYLDKFSDSPIAVNLKACNQYRLYNSKAAENELKALKSMSTSELNFAKDIILHNTISFSELNLWARQRELLDTEGARSLNKIDGATRCREFPKQYTLLKPHCIPQRLYFAMETELYNYFQHSLILYQKLV
uniref:Uncharacterized protein n=1 Tax=Meloidogyne incognita TaxID=6306 RepID=A0A914NS31_MELIC